MTSIQDKAISELKTMKSHTSYSDVEILSAIARGLGEVGGEKAISELKTMKSHTSSSDVKILSAIALAIGRAGRSI